MRATDEVGSWRVAEVAPQVTEGLPKTKNKIHQSHPSRARAYIFFALSFYIIYYIIYLGCRKLHFPGAKNCTS
ncbi:MAG: hypothetical protein IKU13_07320, partial [Clostridia bacterium]|nr:hypothetical protein [Clostridia bacterium]